MPPALDPAALALPVLQDPACAAYVRELLRTRWTDDHDHDAVARVRACVDARTIVFVAVHHGNFPSLEFLAPALRERGHTTLAIYLQGDAHGEGFDHTERCGGSLSRLAALLRALPDGTAIYLQAHARWVWLGQLVAAVAPRLRLVQEIWDWMDQFAPAAHAQDFVDDGVFTHAELALMRGHPQQGFDILMSITDADVRSWCEANLTGYKRPKIIEFRTELPKTPVGKVLRRELRDKK